MASRKLLALAIVPPQHVEVSPVMNNNQRPEGLRATYKRPMSDFSKIIEVDKDGRVFVNTFVFEHWEASFVTLYEKSSDLEGKVTKLEGETKRLLVLLEGDGEYRVQGLFDQLDVLSKQLKKLAEDKSIYMFGPEEVADIKHIVKLKEDLKAVSKLANDATDLERFSTLIKSVRTLQEFIKNAFAFLGVFGPLLALLWAFREAIGKFFTGGGGP